MNTVNRIVAALGYKTLALLYISVLIFCMVIIYENYDPSRYLRDATKTPILIASLGILIFYFLLFLKTL